MRKTRRVGMQMFKFLFSSNAQSDHRRVNIFEIICTATAPGFSQSDDRRAREFRIYCTPIFSQSDDWRANNVLVICTPLRANSRGDFLPGVSKTTGPRVLRDGGRGPRSHKWALPPSL